MVIVKIKAGLGNQMFQYALGKRLAYDWEDDLNFDFSWFENIGEGETQRDIEINKFNIALPHGFSEDIQKATPIFFTMILDKIRGRLDRNFFFTFRPSLLKKKKRVLLDGYFQSYKYIDPIREILLKDFTLKDDFSDEAKQIREQIAESEQSVALHVRRGDFVGSCKDWNGLCSLGYYHKGLDEIQKKYPETTLYIFSDDIEWAKEHFDFKNKMVFVSRPALNAVEELLLMSMCNHQIIANSTYSWWAAWLNKNKKKIVVAPSRWLIAADIDTSDLIPSEWITI